ncbi:hypothetical protein Pla163_33740 [Planctomycetes bacterium Pla163]|uniref:Squalene cyclase C-terminal domain-containing protein n=1 Tax=Rohdeia mirabilis TaxID=2528008 RepID=A0A518D443_9BACT|nr:hypothetical protein Pla163_33740 [Planctomycetes bacterium Pla163]
MNGFEPHATYAPIIRTSDHEEESFGDALYDWMGRAPFLAIAMAVHLLAFFLLAAIPWQAGRSDEPAVFTAEIVPPPADPFEEPVEPPPQIEKPIIDQTEVVIVDVPITDTDDDSDDDTEIDSPQSPFTNDKWNEAIGLGGGAACGGGSRGEAGGTPPGTNTRNERAVMSGLEWLKDHQAPDGRWDCDGFMHDTAREGPVCDGAGDAAHDVGVTGLALLAFMGIGDTLRSGTYMEQIRTGVAYLLDEQDLESGRIGAGVGHAFLYDHAIATLALCEALHGDPNHPLLTRRAQKAVNYISAARNPYGAWRYAVPPNGQQDTSVTGWMVFALAAARDVGLEVADSDFMGALAWIDEVTDPANGRTGYETMGGLSARPEHLSDAYPAEVSEAMTAVAMLSRLFIDKSLGRRDADVDLLEKGASLLLETLPEWSADGSTCDMYAWYYGSYAMFQYAELDPRAWTAWQKAMERAIVPNQRTEPVTFDGSWDPIGPWGESGGRVYSTATMVLSLEVFYRYGKLLGSR